MGAVLAVVNAAEAAVPPPYARNAPSPESGGRWGERVIATGVDANSDVGTAINDVLIADPWATVSGNAQAGAVYLIEGKDLGSGTADKSIPTPIWTLTSPTVTAYEHFGFVVSTIPQASGNPKFVVGSDPQTSGGASTGEGKAWLYPLTSTSPTLATTFTWPDHAGSGNQSGVRFGSRVGAAGDTDHSDSISEIIIGASAENIPVNCTSGAAGCHAGEGSAFIFDGASPYALQRTLRLPVADEATAPCTSNCGSFGLTVSSPGNINGAGVDDQIVSAPSYNAAQGRMYAFNGADGTVYKTINDPTTQSGAFFGFEDVTQGTPGDVNADGKADVYAEGWEQNVGSNTAQGKAWIISGANGTTVLSTLNDPHPVANGQFGWSATKTTYGTGAGSPGVLVGASPQTGTLGAVNENGGANVFDVTTTAATTPIQLPLPWDYQQGSASSNVGPNLGWSVAAPGILKAGDTQPAYIASAPFWDDVAHQDQGLVLAFTPPSYAPAYCAPNPNGSPVTPQPLSCGGSNSFALENCKWPQNGISYFHAGAGDNQYIPIFSAAAGRWNGTASFNMYPTYQVVGDIIVEAADYGNDGADGATQYTCQNGAFVSEHVNAHLNRYYTDGYSTDGQTQVMVHEFGHALGLAHYSGTLCTGIQIMYPSSDRYAQCGVDTPQLGDIAGVRSIYGR